MNDDLTGQTIGPYHIHKVIRAGGMAVIYSAQNIRSGQPVAVKVLFSHLQYYADIVERFHREAKNAADLEHPHIVTVLDDGDLNDGRPYIVMELVDGGDLSDWIKNQQGPFPLPQIDSILSQVASALDYAHKLKVIHRDVKPSNILMTRDGQAKLTDFGIARALQDSRLTTNEMRLGSPTYMSPEQTRGRDAGVQSDVYSLGISIYELLTGQAPFQGDSTAVSYQHVHQLPPPLRQINPALPPAVEKVINKALAKDPKARYQSAGEFSAAFHAALNPENYQLSSQPKETKKTFPLTPILITGAIIAIALVIMALVIDPPLPPPASPSPAPPTSPVTVTPLHKTDAPTPTLPRPNSTALALILKSPADNAVFPAGQVVTFQWRGPSLNDEQVFRVVVENHAENKTLASIRTTGSNISFKAKEFLPGNYSWLVMIEEFVDGVYQETARSPINAFSILPVTTTPTPTATSTPAPRPITPTPAPIEPLALLAPLDGDSFVGAVAEVSFRWSAAERPLRANEYYVLIIEHEQGKDFNWLKTPSYTIPYDKRWLMDLGPGFHWQVVVARQRTGEANENPSGAEISRYSEHRFFRWEK